MQKHNTSVSKCIEKANESEMLMRHGSCVCFNGHCIGQGKKRDNT